MSRVRIKAGDFHFIGVLEEEKAPRTSKWFQSLLPFRSQVIHARWSGEALWTPLGDLETGLSLENQTAYPASGDVLFYPGGISEAEILLPYGSTSFASRAGQLAGNHFMTIITGRERLAELGNHVLWNGAMDIEFDRLD